MKKITLIIIMTLSMMSFTKQPPVKVNPIQYDLRLQFIQDRCRMIEEMFEKQYEKGELKADYAFFYMKMVVSMDSCAADLKHFKTLFK